MNLNNLPENPYLLLTPGPLSTTKGVKAAMLKDWCTWDDDYNNLVQDVRNGLLQLANLNNAEYTTVLMQGSGTFSVESVIGTCVPKTGKILILSNGAYGNRMVKIAKTLDIDVHVLNFSELSTPDLKRIEFILKADSDISHIAMVHCETTTGMLNPIREVGVLAKRFNKTYIVDAMSSFGGIPISVDKWGIDFLISSANKCIQGVPGFGFVIAKTEKLKQCNNQARSHSLDLYDQWETMENLNGKWRFTSPTHVVRAFKQAMDELSVEGGIKVRYERYKNNQRTLVKGMRKLGFNPLLEDKIQSPIITTFQSPESDTYSFGRFYQRLKNKGFVIYPGKVTNFQCFRIGNIGEIHESDINNLLNAIEISIFW
ncbi:2-aminoethylphosphonate--pyruvate transaminase [Puteibacter caeruleilacunae]|nr:2-aminoethylphosphonate--pyruvate transaminase [Puteibacter caeruleilacunae]